MKHKKDKKRVAPMVTPAVAMQALVERLAASLESAAKNGDHRAVARLAREQRHCIVAWREIPRAVQFPDTTKTA